jgi:hypothetical protein
MELWKASSSHDATTSAGYFKSDVHAAFARRRDALDWILPIPVDGAVIWSGGARPRVLSHPVTSTTVHNRLGTHICMCCDGCPVPVHFV